MAIEVKRSVATVREAREIVKAFQTLGAKEIRCEAIGLWVDAKDMEPMHLGYSGIDVLDTRGEKIRVRVSTPDGAEEVWACRALSTVDDRISGAIRITALL